MGKAIVKNMKALSLLCCIALLCTIVAVYHAKDEVAKLTKDMESIQIETISTTDTLRVTKVESYFDLDGEEYKIIRLKGSTVGIIKCTIPLSQATDIEVDSIYEAKMKKLSVVDNKGLFSVTPNRVVEIEFMYEKYINRLESGLDVKSYTEIENSLRQSYINSVLEYNISKISNAMTFIITAYIVSIATCYFTGVMLYKQEN